MDQQGDVLIYQTPDGGDITVEGGFFELSPSLESAVYLALFGGNEQDDGRADNPEQWWGNFLENEPVKQYRSELQYLLCSIPAIPANLLRLEDAVKRDLATLIEVGAMDSVEVSASMPMVNRVQLDLIINGSSELQYSENWEASRT